MVFEVVGTICSKVQSLLTLFEGPHFAKEFNVSQEDEQFAKMLEIFARRLKVCHKQNGSVRSMVLSLQVLLTGRAAEQRWATGATDAASCPWQPHRRHTRALV